MDYSTCRRCRKQMVVLGGDTVHPMCDPLPTQLERLRDNYYGLLAIQGRVDNAGALTPELAELEARIKELENRPPDMARWAARYAGDWHWPVFPLRPGSKEPDTPHGFKDATTDLERIERYWRRHPQANIGIPTGIAFDVIDIDRPKRDGQPDGGLAYKMLLDAGELPDTHGQVATAHAGLHLYVEPTGSGCAQEIEPSVDYRGMGGYVVVPPSMLPAGRWQWLNVPSPAIRR
jgi:hypothetical protein